MNVPTNNKVLEVKNLKKYFPIKKGLFSRTIGYIRAVDDISFTINAKETLGLVGESGCGKTTAGRTILRLIEPTAGKVVFDNHDISALSSKSLKPLRKNMQIIFQDPYASLNPRMTVGSIITEGLFIHRIGTRKERLDRARELLGLVGLSPDCHNRYPHEFSGGQRQRIGIARAIALNPKFIVCDEAVSALDVSVQAQIINLLQNLKEQFHLSFLFISHDLSVVRHMSDKIAVMYFGKIVEYGQTEEIFLNPLHPYTKALLSAIPIPDPNTRRARIILKKDKCSFHEITSKTLHSLSDSTLEEKNPGHFVAPFEKNPYKE